VGHDAEGRRLTWPGDVGDAPRPPVEALGAGRYAVNIDDAEVAVMLDLLGQLRDLLAATDGDEPRLRRLFPTAYHDDPSATPSTSG
jgi:hypothetical protein